MAELDNAHSSAGRPASMNPTWQVLLVTDSHIEQKVATKLLERHGHFVAWAGSVDQAKSMICSQNYDLVLIDWHGCGGDLQNAVEMLGSLSSQPFHLIAFSEHEENEETCRSLGLAGGMRKPIRIEDLNRLMSRLAAACMSACKPCDQEVEPIDWSTALDVVEGRTELLVELVELFFQEYPLTMAEIHSAIEAGNSKQLQLSAHKLKGCLRYFGPNHAATVAQELENLGRSGDLAAAAPKVESLTLAVERMLPLLKNVPR